jgi:outer membrane PBP1 activator LpoA protein
MACATGDTPQPEKSTPHIALLLPLNSTSLGPSAKSVSQGFQAAASVQASDLPIRIYSDFNEPATVVSAYRNAIANGAVAVVGPLTRDGIHQLVEEKNIPVPTLTLNVIEGLVPPQMYFFGMAVDGEARQIAKQAKQQGFKQAIVIYAKDSISQRLQFAFEDKWTHSGGTILREIEYSNDTAVFSDIAATPDTMVFFATDSKKTRTVHSYVPVNLPCYGTSQLFTGNDEKLLNFDLNEIRFVDMPWLMQTDQAAVTTYPHANPPLATDQERLYALGIDAYRLINVLIANQTKTALPLPGVTGTIRLNGRTFVRDAVPSLFVQGHAQAADAPVTPAAQMFPNQFKNASQVEATSAVGVIAKP